MDTPVYIGINLPGKHGSATTQIVDAALEQGYDLITARLTTGAYKKRLDALFPGMRDSREEGHTSLSSSIVSGETVESVEAPSDAGNASRRFVIPAPAGDELAVQPDVHVANTIAVASPWVELDSKNDNFANASLQVLRHEFNHARFCGLPYIIVPGPRRRTNLVRYAHSLSILLRESKQTKVLVHSLFSEEFRDGQPPADLLSIWQVWDTVRTICDYPANLSLALEVSKYPLPDYVLARWFCEPVSMIIVSAARSFVHNPKGYPVLPKQTQNLFHMFAERKPLLLIKDNIGLATLNGEVSSEAPTMGTFTGGDESFLIYLRHLMSKQKELSKLDSFSAGYADVLQAPLQPLKDDLDSSTYEIFEKDNVKYSQYQAAIEQCMARDLLKINPLNVVVAGAGRGALVDRVLAAAVKVGKQLQIHVLEKNPSAGSYLSMRQRFQWGPQVQVHIIDMRVWNPSEKPHLVVSELMGSLGDNELSPECLDHLESVLDPQGVMIPRSYTAFLAPIFSPKLYASARSAPLPAHYTASPSPFLRNDPRLQTPYVVHMQQVELLAPPSQLWTFNHPDRESQPHNRSARVNFVVPNKAVLHGFAGYFESELYPGIFLSSNPTTRDQKSPDLVSWFPIWFPVVTPIRITANSDVDVSIWRQTDPHRVWYEWAVDVGQREGKGQYMVESSVLHNVDGECYFVST